MLEGVPEHPGLAGAADTLLAGGRDVEAGLAQGFQDGHAGLDDELTAGFGQRNHKAALDRLGGRAAEILHVDQLGRPAGGCGLEGGQHGARAAAVEVRAFRRGGDDGGHIEHSAGLDIDVQARGRRHPLQFVQERGVGAGAHSVVHLE